MLSMGDFSTELCGGTTPAALVILVCSIISESGIAAGVRRIEAVIEKVIATAQTAIVYEVASAERR